jgi:muramoyltetrapeptide carboxypeptidase
MDKKICMYGGRRVKKGTALQLHDTIGLIAPASPGPKERLQKAKEKIEALGFKVKIGDSCYGTYGGYLTGTPEERVEDLHRMFADEEVNAVMCLRGGYGTPQLLPYLDFDLISRHPKLFIGYSDITALHIAFLQNAGLVTLHGPMGSSDFAEGLDDFTIDSIMRALTEEQPLGEIVNPAGFPMHCMVEGKAGGAIVGGNLSLICALMGTPYELDTKGKLLFLEDVGEEPYRVDRMLTQLALAGKFEDAAGIIFGTWTDCEANKHPDGFSVEEVLTNIIKPYGKPTIFNVQAGHNLPMITLPFGVHASMDAAGRTLVVTESVVTQSP